MSFRALNDHSEVKLVLFHPSVLESPYLKSLSSTKGVHFYCGNCSTRLTRSSCCCSFGGIREKLVNRFTDAYTCAKGIRLLNSTAVFLSKDDLIGYFGSNFRRHASCDSHCKRVDANRTLRSLHLNFNNHAENIKYKVREEEPNANGLFFVPLASDLSENYVEVSTLEVLKLSLADHTKSKAVKAMENGRSFLNDFLGDVFMARSYNLSMDIEWKQFYLLNPFSWYCCCKSILEELDDWLVRNLTKIKDFELSFVNMYMVGPRIFPSCSSLFFFSVSFLLLALR
ncbi:hypothetical protein P3X46_004643 [Hevea brasiliensis]|uniref:Uncharacterized protein n=1 Tax=Hevea brasiliensis TaxID=3981 RepID=A0ABQ9N289_HEVBR|nr:hypothetical protein P3X46_004643 [Hevea brasiliensis]